MVNLSIHISRSQTLLGYTTKPEHFTSVNSFRPIPAAEVFKMYGPMRRCDRARADNYIMGVGKFPHKTAGKLLHAN